MVNTCAVVAAKYLTKATRKGSEGGKKGGEKEGRKADRKKGRKEGKKGRREGGRDYFGSQLQGTVHFGMEDTGRGMRQLVTLHP